MHFDTLFICGVKLLVWQGGWFCKLHSHHFYEFAGIIVSYHEMSSIHGQVIYR